MKKIKTNIIGQSIYSNDSLAYSLHEKSYFGDKKNGKIQYSLNEALYLIENQKIDLISNKKIISFEEALKKFRRIDNKIHLKYIVFRNLRKKGYILKTALKFGADFRVYEKGKNPEKAHSKWIVFVEHENSRITWHEFSAKNRVAHSTKKKLLMAIIDDEEDVIYYEISWTKT